MFNYQGYSITNRAKSSKQTLENKLNSNIHSNLLRDKDYQFYRGVDRNFSYN